MKFVMTVDIGATPEAARHSVNRSGAKAAPSKYNNPPHPQGRPASQGSHEVLHSVSPPHAQKEYQQRVAGRACGIEEAVRGGEEVNACRNLKPLSIKESKKSLRSLKTFSRMVS
jgi:hypothetical protein